MGIRKRCICIALILILCAGFASVQAAETSISIDDAAGRAGELVDIYVNFHTEQKITAIELVVEYDPAILRIENADAVTMEYAGEANWLTEVDVSKSGKVIIAGAAGTETAVKGVCAISCRIGSNVQAGKYKISIASFQGVAGTEAPAFFSAVPYTGTLTVYSQSTGGTTGGGGGGIGGSFGGGTNIVIDSSYQPPRKQRDRQYSRAGKIV